MNGTASAGSDLFHVDAPLIFAWFIVDAAFNVLWVIVRLVIVAVVAVVVYFALRAWLRWKSERDSIER